MAFFLVWLFSMLFLWLRTTAMTPGLFCVNKSFGTSTAMRDRRQRRHWQLLSSSCWSSLFWLLLKGSSESRKIWRGKQKAKIFQCNSFCFYFWKKVKGSWLLILHLLAPTALNWVAPVTNSAFISVSVLKCRSKVRGAWQSSSGHFAVQGLPTFNCLSACPA